MFGEQTKVINMKKISNFCDDQFLHDLQPKQILKQTDRQTINFQMATILTMVPPEKKKIFFFYLKLINNNNNNKS